jgi:hypothetical protein
MSLCIGVVIPEGIVIAGESRQIQVVAGVNRLASDSATKVFALSDTILAATAGWAFLQPQGTTLMSNISSLVEDFKPTISAGSGVQRVAADLCAHFNTIYQQHVAQYPNTAVTAPQMALNFIVAGYDPGSRLGQLFGIDVPATTSPTQANRTSNSPGPWWIGQTDIVARIINGYDPRLLSLASVQPAVHAGTAIQDLNKLGYVVYWNTMTMQDAIDFAVNMIQVTTTIQKFTAGIAMQLGAVAGVGGPIDIAVVEPGGRARWINRKGLHP